MTDPRDVVNRQFEEVVNGRRRDVAAEVFHPDMKILRMGIQEAALYLMASRGRGNGAQAGEGSEAGFRQMGAVLDAAFPDARLDVVGPQVAEGDLVVTRVRFSGTHQGDFFGLPPTHRKVEFDEVLFMTVTGGKISEVWALGDELSFLRQLGAVKPGSS